MDKLGKPLLCTLSYKLKLLLLPFDLRIFWFLITPHLHFEKAIVVTAGARNFSAC